MTGIGIFLLSTAMADMIACGLSGQPKDGPRPYWGIAAGLLVAVFGCYLGGFSAQASGVLCFLIVTGTGCWLFFRRTQRSSFALIGLGAVFCLVLMASHLWEPSFPQWLRSWHRHLGVPRMVALSLPNLILLAGVLGFLLAPANGIVRAVLDTAGTRIEESQKQLRGGRLIGVLERLLIFGLVLGGQGTAAGLVVSAKSLMRFPELSRSGAAESSSSDNGSDNEGSPRRIDYITEYFLLGSMVSWFLAFAPVLLF